MRGQTDGSRGTWENTERDGEEMRRRGTEKKGEEGAGWETERHESTPTKRCGLANPAVAAKNDPISLAFVPSLSTAPLTPEV